ncbi:MAG: hypothetical protein PHI29_12455 [Gallionella sp.]|nr:hypothetical protein [Gallionella sp.]
MNQFSKEIEAAFLPTATQYASEGTERESAGAPVDACSGYGYTPFAAGRGATAKKLVVILKKHSSIPMPQPSKTNSPTPPSSRQKKAAIS